MPYKYFFLFAAQLDTLTKSNVQFSQQKAENDYFLRDTLHSKAPKLITSSADKVDRRRLKRERERENDKGKRPSVGG